MSVRDERETSISFDTRLFFGFAILFAMVGCSGADQVVPQRGIVTLNGQPLEGLRVTFFSTQNKTPASATTDEEGKFELTTFKPGDGVLRGEYLVVLASNAPEPQIDIPGAPPRPVVVDSGKKAGPAIHANYRSPQKTPLRVVVPAPEGTIKLELNKTGS